MPKRVDILGPIGKVVETFEDRETFKREVRSRLAHKRRAEETVVPEVPQHDLDRRIKAHLQEGRRALILQLAHLETAPLRATLTIFGKPIWNADF